MDAPIALISEVVSIAFASVSVQVATHFSSSLKIWLFAGIVNLLFFSVPELDSDVSVMVARTKSPSIVVAPVEMLCYCFISLTITIQQVIYLAPHDSTIRVYKINLLVSQKLLNKTTHDVKYLITYLP